MDVTLKLTEIEEHSSETRGNFFIKTCVTGFKNEFPTIKIYNI